MSFISIQFAGVVLPHLPYKTPYLEAFLQQFMSTDIAKVKSEYEQQRISNKQEHQQAH